MLFWFWFQIIVSTFFYVVETVFKTINWDNHINPFILVCMSFVLTNLRELLALRELIACI